MIPSPKIETTRTAGEIASHVIRTWPADRPFTVESVLRERPDLVELPSVLVELAYEEFCRLDEGGNPVPPSEFVVRFPEIERSLRRVLVIDGYCKRSNVRDLLLGHSWPDPGEEVAGFRLVEQIGRGAESRVFLAHDLEVGERIVVVKVGPGCHEAATLGTLDHPGIVPVLTARRDPERGLGVLCMPYLGRATLDAVIARLFDAGQPRTAADLADAVRSVAALASDRADVPSGSFATEVSRIAAALAAALAYAHSRGVIHSDVKPSNVLMTAARNPMLLDFNLAWREGQTPARAGGTLPYMAPELLVGWPKGDRAPTFASDVFSLGVTLRQFLTGESPAGALDLSDPVAAATEFARIRSRPPEAIPAAFLRGNRRLGDVILACLSPDPQLRPTAEAIARDLQTTVSPIVRIRQAAQVRRREVLGILGTGLVLGATSAAWTMFRPPQTERRWAAGLAAAQAGLFTEAEAAFDDVVAARPADAWAIAARGWCRLRAGDPRLAYADIKAARELEDDGKFDALLGYCLLWLTEDAGEAQTAFETAIARGHETAPARNGAGYCCLTVGRLADATKHLRRALEIDSECGQVHHAMALVDRHIATRDGRAPDLEHIRAALDKAPASPGLYLDAALVFAVACARGKEEEASLIRCLSRAIDLGADPGRSAELIARIHAPIQQDPRFRAAARQNSGPSVTAAELRLACVAPPVRDPRDFFAGRTPSLA